MILIPVGRVCLEASPFIKWVGGKRSIIEDLLSFIPKEYNNYYEPFIGGGALFFELNNKNSFISDSNLELITTYKVVRDNINELINQLKTHKELHDSDYYYYVRSLTPENDIEIASRMIYLNKTCFNGLYRVNKKGLFNTPLGKSPNMVNSILREDNLRQCSLFLQDTNILNRDYSEINPNKKDFVYFDPPYDTESNGFLGYSKDIFDRKNQKELFDFFVKLTNKGVFCMLSNLNTEFIRDLYKDYNINTINCKRFINSDSLKRGNVSEVIITNY
jgi:DNA adenine methylase